MKQKPSRIWIFIFSAMAVSELPFFFGWALTPKGGTFYGNSALNFSDPSVYYSYIEQGRTGGPFMTDILTSEQYSATLFQPFWWVLGKVATVLHISNPAVFAGARLALVVWFVWAIWWTVRWVFHDVRVQSMAMILALFASGVGGIIALFYKVFQLTISPDLWVAEAFPILTLWSSPHFLLVSGCLLVIIVAVEKSWALRKPFYLLLAGVVGIIATSIHPFHVITLGLFALAQTTRYSIVQRRVAWRYLGRWSAVMFMISPMVLLFGMQFVYDPLTIARAGQNINFTWPWQWTFAALGLLLPMAVIYAWRRRHEATVQWLTLWAVVALLAIYVPVEFQRRLGQNLSIPFALLAAPIALQYWDWARKAPGRQLTTIIAIFVLFFSGIRVGAEMVRGYVYERQVAPVRLSYLTPEYHKLLQMVRNYRNSNGALLGSVTDSRVIASLTGQPAFVAHSVETINFQKKELSMQAFYADRNLNNQKVFLQKNNICFVLYGSRERYFGNRDQLSNLPDLQLIFQGDHWQLYHRSTCQN